MPNQLSKIFKKIIKDAEGSGSRIGSKLSKEEAEAAHDLFKLSPSMARETIDEQAKVFKPRPEMGVSPLKEIENRARATESLGEVGVPGISKAADTVKINPDPNFTLKGEPYKNPYLPVTSMERKAATQGEKSLAKVEQPALDAAYKDVSEIPAPVPKIKPKSNTSRNIGLGLAGIGALGLLNNGSEEVQNKLVQPEVDNTEESDVKTPEIPKSKNPYKQIKPSNLGKSKEQPATEQDLSGVNPDDKALEQNMQNEDFVANEKSTIEEQSKAPGFEMDLGQQNYNVVDALKNAQESRDRQVLFNQLGQISERGGAAIGGYKPLYNDVYETNIKLANQKVQDVKDRMAQEGNDPNSQTSKAFKQYLAKMGVKVSGDMSAETGSKIVPLVFKDFEAKAAQEARAQGAKEKRESDERMSKERVDAQKFTAEQNRISRKEAAKEAAENRKAMLSIKTEEKQDQMDTKRLDDLGKRLTSEIASSRSAFGRASNNIRAAEAIEALGDQYKDKGQLDKRQVYELARSLDNLLAPGQGSISGTIHLIPSTAIGDVSKIAEYIGNLPVGAGQADFVKRTLDTVAREKELAKKQILQTQSKVLGSYKDAFNRQPEKARNILEPHGLGFVLDSNQQPEKQEAPKTEQKTVIKKGYNPSTNQTQLIYSDGSKEIVEGRK